MICKRKEFAAWDKCSTLEQILYSVRVFGCSKIKQDVTKVVSLVKNGRKSTKYVQSAWIHLKEFAAILQREATSVDKTVTL